MDKRDYLIILYDYYGELLNEKQKTYFEEYYFNNLSLGEISENLNISRNAVHKCLIGIEEKLAYFEEKLKLYEKTNRIRDIIKENNIDDIKASLKELIKWDT